MTRKIIQNSLFNQVLANFDIRSFLILKNAAQWYKNYLIPSVERPEQARNVIFIDFSRIFCVLEMPALVSAY